MEAAAAGAPSATGAQAAAQAAAQEAAQAAPAAAFAKRKNRGNLRKRAADSDEDGGGGGDDGGGAQRKAAKSKEGSMAFTTKRTDRAELFAFESSNAIQQERNDATRGNEQETAHDRDSRALRERVLAQAVGEDALVSGEGDTKEYHGMNQYRDYRAGFRREHTVGAEKGAGTHGPLRASANVRMTVRIDYQPDICKDYKETGYCGYGDACKFMHDRGDYKAGWEIDRDWNAVQKEKREKMLAGWKPEDEDDEEKESEEDDELPFACFICRRVWADAQDPVVTKCKHYFCEQCALQHNAKSAKCFVCEQPTGGIFNVAHDVVRREKARQRKEGGE
ncbi:zinc finger CCCH domain-containing 1 [Micractinium conductrix]|uniref:Zinc finger CCCH domain-containing 1 n=1 Tax=Micractinium conductrix TaxID=554055 RepID=A0A2P6VDQ4_9CHLO|nr:zinc finger CCCH domain-containing 1 [Micractinium conductrix]|eukprot:PSC72199.1 zinc finger CCCH domain-containing 1 [Micractinium conductrix]